MKLLLRFVLCQNSCLVLTSLKKIICICTFLFICQQVVGQGIKPLNLLRSSIGISGSSDTYLFQGKSITIQQTFGQNGSIGAISKSGFILRQGFLQPLSSSYLETNTLPEPFNFKIFPNPFHDKIQIYFDNRKVENISVVITDLLGRIVYSSEFEATNLVSFEIKDLASATYIIIIQINENRIIRKLVKI